MRKGLLSDIIEAGMVISLDGDDIILTAMGEVYPHIEPLLEELRAAKPQVLKLLREKLRPGDPYPKLIWTNPFPAGSKEARAESLRVVKSFRGRANRE